MLMCSKQVNAASRLAPGKVDLALSLVGYPEEVEKAMGFVFGSTFVCKDSETAKQVTFSKEIGGARSVTLEGDVYEPSGTLSGGAAPTSNGILVKVQDLLDAERRLGEAKGRLDVLEKQNEKDRDRRERWNSATRDLQIKQHEKKLFEEQLGGSNASRVNHTGIILVVR
jgi:structural maintenance of chromosome 2